jgi:hypothetical protein
MAAAMGLFMPPSCWRGGMAQSYKSVSFGGSGLTKSPLLLMNPALSGPKGAEILANSRESEEMPPCPAAAN